MATRKKPVGGMTWWQAFFLLRGDASTPGQLLTEADRAALRAEHQAVVDQARLDNPDAHDFELATLLSGEHCAPARPRHRDDVYLTHAARFARTARPPAHLARQAGSGRHDEDARP